MAVEIGHLHKRRLVKDMRGNIIDWFDEANGGWIVQKRVIVNKDRYNEEMTKLQDKRDAAKAASEAKVRDEENYPAEAPNEEKKPKLEERVDGLESKLDAILNKLNGTK